MRSDDLPVFLLPRFLVLLGLGLLALARPRAPIARSTQDRESPRRDRAMPVAVPDFIAETPQRRNLRATSPKSSDNESGRLRGLFRATPVEAFIGPDQQLQNRRAVFRLEGDQRQRL